MTSLTSWHARTWAALLAAFALVLGFSVPMLMAPAQADPPEDAPAEGTNVALASNGAVVSSSGVEEGTSYTEDLAVDGDQATRWSSDHSDDAWIQVELAQPTVVDHVTIYWEAACAAKYKLQVSSDGQTWTDATDVITPTCASTDRQQLSVSDPVAFVRMQAIERTPIGGKKWGVSLYEFQVWDGPEPAEEPLDAAIIPKPLYQQVDTAAEPFELTADSRIVTDAAAQGEADLLATQLRTATGFELPVTTSGTPDADDIGLTVVEDLAAAVPGEPIDPSEFDDTGLDGTTEAYYLTTGADGATITAESSHGVFNGTRTLLQLLPVFAYSTTEVSTTWSAPAAEIVDAPRYDYRGIMLDVARSFLTVEEVQHVIDQLAANKASTLHLHLADDQGWRIQITNEGKAEGDTIDYTRLTEISGKTAMTNAGYKNELGHTGFYTQEEYSQIVEYAAQRHITIIPEIDLPGHTNAALHAIPQLNTAGSSHEGTESEPVAPANGTGDVGYSYLDPNSEVSYTFVEHVLSQIAALTPGDYLHIGGDESHAMTARYGAEGYSTFIERVTQIVHDLGKKPLGWSEYAEATLNPGDGVQYWVGGTDNVERAVNQEGAKVLMSRGVSSYIDMKYNAKTPIGATWACYGNCDFPAYYNWNPETVIPNVDDSGILGNEAPMWSETIRGGSQAEFMVFPRALSHAEIGWSAQEDRNVADFTERMGAAGLRMLIGGWNFYDGPKAQWDYAAAGTDIAASPGRELTFDVGILAAPGTKAADDGASVSVDDVDDADGVSSSDIQGELTATVDFGDGTEPQPVTFTAEQARDALHAGGLYTLSAQHTYTEPGTYTGTITWSDGGADGLARAGGNTTTFTAAIAEGTPDPSEPQSPWDPATEPSVSFTDDAAAAGDRTEVSFSGFEPGEHVMLTFDGEPTNSVVPGEDGTITVWWQVPPSAYAGSAELVATQGDRTASDTLEVTDGRKPLPNPIPQSQYEVSDFSSQETVGEPEPSGFATAAIDGDASTYWHTKWQGGAAPLPAHITLDLGGNYDVGGFEYTPRQSNTNGLIADYEIYVSADGQTWGEPVATGTFPADSTRSPVLVEFAPKEGRYVKLVATSTQAGNEFAGAAELRVGGLAVDDGSDGADGGADGGADSGTDGGSTAGADGSAEAGSDGSTGADADGSTSSDGSDSQSDGTSDTGGDGATNPDGASNPEGPTNPEGEADVNAAADPNTSSDPSGPNPEDGPSDGPADASAEAAAGAEDGGGHDGSDGADGSESSGTAAADPHSGSQLPDTGASVTPYVIAALLAVAAGVGLLLVRRRRQQQ